CPSKESKSGEGLSPSKRQSQTTAYNQVTSCPHPMVRTTVLLAPIDRARRHRYTLGSNCFFDSKSEFFQLQANLKGDTGKTLSFLEPSLFLGKWTTSSVPSLPFQSNTIHNQQRQLQIP
ncbi:12943_t:CDS:2, partial [Dentiscutata heterogama]